MEMFAEIDVQRLARLPLAYLAEQEELFNHCCRQGDVDERYRDIFILGVWAYQLHTYLRLVGLFFGSAKQQQVRRLQLQTLAREGGARQLMEQAFAVIESVVNSKHAPKPISRRDVPIELNIALAMLLKIPASPDYAASPARINAMDPNTDSHFSMCLARGRARIHDVFDLMLALPYDAASLQ